MQHNSVKLKKYMDVRVNARSKCFLSSSGFIDVHNFRWIARFINEFIEIIETLSLLQLFECVYMHIHVSSGISIYTSLIFPIKHRFGGLSGTLRSRHVIKLGNEALRWFYVINNTSDSTRERVSTREVDHCISD